MNKQPLKFSIDLDGVLADFDTHFINVFGMTSAEAEKTDKLWPLMESEPNFYRNMPLMPDSIKLFNYIFNNFECDILTAIPRQTTVPQAEDDKRAWVKEFLNLNVQMKIGPFSKDKQRHCEGSHHVLIDDRRSNIDDWIAAGGIGILHTDVLGTFNKIQEYLRDNSFIYLDPIKNVRNIPQGKLRFEYFKDCYDEECLDCSGCAYCDEFEIFIYPTDGEYYDISIYEYLRTLFKDFEYEVIVGNSEGCHSIEECLRMDHPKIMQDIRKLLGPKFTEAPE